MSHTNYQTKETLNCPLTNNSELILLETIKVHHIIKAYKKIFNLNVEKEFKGIKEISFYHCPSSDLRFFHPFVLGSEAFYEDLQKFDWYYMAEKAEYDYALQFIQETNSILEIGCGKGVFLQKVLSKYPQTQCTGLELSDKAQKTGSKNGLNVIKELVQDHALQNSHQYDVVCAFQVLEHIAEVRSFIEACVSCLKPGGLLIYAVPSWNSFNQYVPNSILDMPPHHITKWSDKSLANLTKYFSLEHLQLWHEPLDMIHKNFYSATIIKNSFSGFFNKKLKLFNTGVDYYIIDLLSKILGRLFAKGLTSEELMPKGMSVVSVYRKLKS